LKESHNTELVLLSCSAEETRRFGASLAHLLAPGDLLCLFGDLGAGKTTFVQGLARGLGTHEPATSPSFTLIHEHSGSPPLYHLDLYRLGSGDLTEVGVEEALRAPAVVVVEWAERLPEELSAECLRIEFSFGDEAEGRRVVFRTGGSRSAEIISQFESSLHADSVDRNRH